MKILTKTILVLFLATLSGAVMGAPRSIKVTATTAMVADLVTQVGGERVKVQGLMGPGVDPHLYKAAASDIIKLQGADIIFYNGLLLEGKMTDLFSKMTRFKKPVYAVTESIPKSKLLAPPEFAGHYDPHVWFDISLWSECVDTVVKGLTATEPQSRDYFARRGRETKVKLQDLHKWTLEAVQVIPPSERILVTSHDAYGYFGRAYGFQVVGLQGISTVSEAGLADIAKMVDFIKSRGVKAIFVESSVSPAAINRISQDSGVRVGGELFSDAMGTPGQIENGYDLGTYEGMIKHNISLIVEALR